jgi:shikimate kinase
MVQTLTPNLVLIGYMGTGKTTIARICARALGFRCVDTDQRIERHAGRSIAALFAEVGEAEFRRMESEAVRELSGRANVVIATGGGVVLDDLNVEVLRASGVLIWLRVCADEILQRCGNRASRPVLAGAEDPLGVIRAMLAEREPRYAAAADAGVHTSGLKRDDAALLVLRAYRPLAAAWPNLPGRNVAP